MYKIIMLVILVAAAGLAGAATYYVDEVNGVDGPARSGGPGDPWRTITYALSRVSGENTFMCRGMFEETVRVLHDDRESEFTANPEATLMGRFEPDYETTAALNGFRVYGYARIGEHRDLYAEGCYFNNPSGPALAMNG